MAAKRKFLSLEEKCSAIKLLENGMPAYTVAEQLGVGKTLIQNLRKRKSEVMTDVENNVPLSTKRRRHCTGNRVFIWKIKKTLLISWFVECINSEMARSSVLSL
jgi:hypothetical protein